MLRELRGSSYLRENNRRLWLAALALLAIACTPPPEYPLLQQFFSASRLRDLTALHSIATVVFEPRTQGVVTDFTITTVTARREDSREFKDVTISAKVRAFAGETTPKTLMVTLEQIDGRWMVTQIQ